MDYTVETKKEKIKSQYIDSILEKLKRSNDISLMDLILKLLEKSG